MIKKYTVLVTNWLISCNAISEEDRELYEYAIYSILITISPLFLATLVGILLGAVLQSILIILPFFLIRKFSGGYHAKKAGICLIYSSMLLILCIFLSSWVKCNILLLFLTALSAMSLLHFSPIENENRLLSREERICFKKVTTIIVTSIIIAELLLLWFSMYTFVVCISIGLILSASLQYPCIIGKMWNKIDQK